MCTYACILRGRGKPLICPKKVDRHFHVKILITQMNVQCSSLILLRETLHAQLQMDRFRFVNYQKFMTKRVILRIVVQSGKIISIEIQSSF